SRSGLSFCVLEIRNEYGKSGPLVQSKALPFERSFLSMKTLSMKATGVFMVIEHTAHSWPEAVGKLVQCCQCGRFFQSDECLSLATNQEVDGLIQVPMFLVCI